MKAETNQEVRKLLNILPLNYRDAIILKYWHYRYCPNVAYYDQRHREQVLSYPAEDGPSCYVTRAQTGQLALIMNVGVIR